MVLNFLVCIGHCVTVLDGSKHFEVVEGVTESHKLAASKAEML